jgi:hypothetical protein
MPLLIVSGAVAGGDKLAALVDEDAIAILTVLGREVRRLPYLSPGAVSVAAH